MRLCCEGPLVQVDPDGSLYQRVRPEDAGSIVEALDGGRPSSRSSRRPGSTLLRPADGDRAREQRADRARADRVVHRGGRVSGALPRPPRDDPGAGRRGDLEERPAGPRRRRVSDRPEMGDGRQAAGDAQVRRLQRRRGRPRRLHGPQRARERPAPRPRRDGDRGLRGRGQPGLHVRPRRVSAGHPPARHGDQAGQEVRAARAARSSNRRSTSGSTSGSAPAPSSAARRPR